MSSLVVEEAKLGGREEDDDQMQQTDADILKHDLIKVRFSASLRKLLLYGWDFPCHVFSCLGMVIYERVGEVVTL